MPRHPVPRTARPYWARAAAAMLMLVSALALGAMSGAPVHAGQLGPDDLPVTTVPNDFYPEERDLSDCLSALPKPGCGSEARGGWAQSAVFGLIVLGVGAVAARVIISSRRTRAARAPEAAP